MNAGELAKKLEKFPAAEVCVDFVRELRDKPIKADDSFDVVAVTIYHGPHTANQYVTLHFGTPKMRAGLEPYTLDKISIEEVL